MVSFAVKNNWWGIENLSHIPGSTGAIAVQNVGAYGQEAGRVIESVTVFNKETHAIQSLKNKDCGFGYRKSVFNSSEKGKYIIFDVTFLLAKERRPNLTYRDLNVKFTGKNPSIIEIRQAIIDIRDKKFPFPREAKNGNAGSFFKNPILDETGYEKLKQAIVKNFGLEKGEDLEKKKFKEGGQVKIPAAFLIELCGLKGQEFGGAAINENQPLVIINKFGSATAKDVLGLAENVRQEVYKQTGVALSYEPELIGF